MSMRKEISLPATVRVTLGSIEAMRVGAWGPGHLQTSVASLRSLGRAGSEDSCSRSRGDVQIYGWGFGQSTFQCPFMPQLGHGPGGGLVFRHERAQWPSLLHLQEGPGGFLSFLADGGLEPCRAVAKTWHLA